MKKLMIIAAAALVCFSFASCEKGVCKCTIKANGEKSTVTYNEEELQKQGASTCKDLGTILEKTAAIGEILFEQDYSANCK